MPDLTKKRDPLSFIAGNGDMARRIRAFDWSQHPFGPLENWPQSLRSALSICLHSAFPTAIYWGPELRLLYNDAWAPIPGPRHPAALGKPAKEVWADIWDIIWPQFRHLLETGEGFYAENQMLPMRRYGFEEETYWNYSFTAIRGEDGRIAGIFNSGFEMTDTVLSERRLKFMLNLNERLHEETNSESAAETATSLLGAHLGVAHAGYLALREGNGAVRLVHDWAAEGSTFTPHSLRLSAFGRGVERRLAAGEVLRIEDVESYAQAAEETAVEAFRKHGIRAALFVPLLHGGRLAAVLYAVNGEARHWTDHEVLTLQEALQATWDIVQILRNEERQELLMREVDHRAKNALAVVKAVVHLSQADGMDDFRQVVEGRIAALARAHDLLAGSRWRGVDLRGLIEEELTAFTDQNGRRVTIDGPALRLPPQLSQSVALALHELATNAAKYGALRRDGGSLAVTWRKEEQDQKPRLVLEWRETTTEPIQPPSARRGFGSELLNKSIRSQLDGEISFDWALDGLKCRLSLPLMPKKKKAVAKKKKKKAVGPAAGSAATARPSEAPESARVTKIETAPRAKKAPAPLPAAKAPAAGAQPRVLLAEDEPLVSMDLESRLVQFGYDVSVAVDSVDAALRALETELPDIALLDANLHGESSVSVAVELHKRGVPLAFITGYEKIDGLPDQLATAPKLAKPVLDADLRQTIEGLLAGADIASAPSNMTGS
ncbi:MAG: hypothetical protein Tsb0032_35370 [Kiloniellaceae bacterium]